MSIWKSIKGLFGQTIHYKDGQYAGESWDGIVPGSKTHYDANGSYAGYSDPGLFGSQIHHDEFGGKTGETWTDSFGVSRHYDEKGYVGSSYDGFVSHTTYVDEEPNSIFDRDHEPNSIFDDSFEDSSW